MKVSSLLGWISIWTLSCWFYYVARCCISYAYACRLYSSFIGWIIFPGFAFCFISYVRLYHKRLEIIIIKCWRRRMIGIQMCPQCGWIRITNSISLLWIVMHLWFHELTSKFDFQPILLAKFCGFFFVKSQIYIKNWLWLYCVFPSVLQWWARLLFRVRWKIRGWIGLVRIRYFWTTEIASSVSNLKLDMTTTIGVRKMLILP